MKTPVNNNVLKRDRANRSGPRTTFAFYGTVLAFLLATAMPAVALHRNISHPQQSENDKDSIGFNLGKNASAKEIGLPFYPSSHRQQDDSDDSSALNVGLRGGSSGFKLIVVKLESADAPDKVAAFYRKALAKYGPVLDCSNPAPSSAKKEDSVKKSSKELTCEDEKPKKDEISLKSGTKEKQHAVAIQPQASGSRFQLVYVEAHSTDEQK